MKPLLITMLWHFVAGVFSGLLYGQPGRAAIDSLASDFFNKNGPGGSVLVAKEGAVVYRQAFGKSNLELDIAMKPDDNFRIGSITKQFTACAILKLVEEGKMCLRDSLTKFIATYPTHGHNITIEHLLTHTSGIRNYTDMTAFNDEMKRRDLRPEKLIELFQNEPLDFAPGTRFRYSNSGYILLGYIIELVSGRPYGEYVKENFFEPLGMNRSFYDNAATLIKGKVNGYKRRNNTYTNADFLSMTLPYAAGSLVTNVDDLLKWYQALLREGLVNKTSLQQAFTSYQLADSKQTGYGYGWQVGNIQKAGAVMHVGRINGFVTFALFLPKENILVCIFSNCECSENIEYTAFKIAAIALGSPYHFDPVRLSAPEMKGFEGIYAADSKEEKTIRLENGRLVFFSKGGLKNELMPVAKGKLLINNSLSLLVFDSIEKNKRSFQIQGTGLPETWHLVNTHVPSIPVFTMAVDSFMKFSGDYEFSADFIFKVLIDGDKIYGQVGEDRKQLLPFGSRSFYAKELDAVIHFHSDNHNKITGLTKIQRGEMTARKIK